MRSPGGSGGPGPPQDDLRAPPGDPQDPSETHLGPPWAALGPPRAPLGGDGLAQTAKTMILLKLSLILRGPPHPQGDPQREATRSLARFGNGFGPPRGDYRGELVARLLETNS